MKNERAFTLVELIATILVICLISLLAVTSINKVIRDSNSNGHKIQVNEILSSAISYVSENDNIKEIDMANLKIYLSTLQQNGYIDSKIIDPKNKKEINLSSSYITITKVTNTSSTDNTNLDYMYNGNYLYVLTLVYK